LFGRAAGLPARPLARGACRPEPRAHPRLAGFEFEQVWRERNTFLVENIPVHVARLTHIVSSKAIAGRPKDHLFFATHKEALEEYLRRDPPAER
jgi:hypothetical protein